MLNISFILEVISRSQLPQNSEILYCSFGRRLFQNQHENDWNITVCVVLVSPYSVQELPSPNCMRHHLFVSKNPQPCSKSFEKKRHEIASLEKTRNSFSPLCYGFFSADTEYVRQHQQFEATQAEICSVSHECSFTTYSLHSKNVSACYLLWKWCQNPVFVQDWQWIHLDRVVIFIWNFWCLCSHVIDWSQYVMQMDIPYLCWKLACW